MRGSNLLNYILVPLKSVAQIITDGQDGVQRVAHFMRDRYIDESQQLRFGVLLIKKYSAGHVDNL